MSIYNKDLYKGDNISLKLSDNTDVIHYLRIKLIDDVQIECSYNVLSSKTSNSYADVNNIYVTLPPDTKYNKLYEDIDEYKFNAILEEIRSADPSIPNLHNEIVATSEIGFTNTIIQNLLNIDIVERVSTEDKYVLAYAPDFEEKQYNLKNNHFGLYIKEAWRYGATGEGVKIAVGEYGQRFHYDFPDDLKIIGEVPDGLPSKELHHGTCCLGIVSSKKDGYGVTGIAYGSQHYFFCASMLTRMLEYAIANDFGEGDVISVSLCSGDENGKMVPLTASKTAYDAIKVMTNLGITVCIAAGNSNINLDNYDDVYKHKPFNPIYDSSGVVIVGASHSQRGKASYSNYGKIVKLFAGDYVIAPGRIDFSDYYNSGEFETSYCLFNGTSCATPQVASVIALVQSYRKKKGLPFLNSFEMVSLLKNTGRRYETSTQYIGESPDVLKAIGLFDRLEIEKSTDGLVFNLVDTIPYKDGSEYVDTDVEVGNTYFYRVKRKRSSLESPYSEVVGIKVTENYGLNGIFININDEIVQIKDIVINVGDVIKPIQKAQINVDDTIKDVYVRG